MLKFSPERLNALRLERGMTYEDLAAALRAAGLDGMRLSSVWRHCSGKTEPLADTVGAYAEALHVEVRELFEP